MVKYSPSQLDATFSALSDATRRAMLVRLTTGEASVSELAKPFGVSLPAVMKHVSVLRKAGLVRTKKVGRVQTCQIQPKQLQQAEEWIRYYRQFWNQRFDALEEILKEKK